MVAQMDERSMRMVVQGLKDPPNDRSRGLASCSLQKTDRYDHKRHHALGDDAGPEMLCIWDFVLVCEDGSQVGLHPNYSNTKFGAYKGPAPQDHELPRDGLGGSSGPHTFQYFAKKHIQKTLRFDPRKRPAAATSRMAVRTTPPPAW